MIVDMFRFGDINNYTTEHISAFTDAEPWLPESGVITVSFSLRMNVPSGEYEVLLEMNDPQDYGNPDYNILLTNESENISASCAR